MLDSSIRHPKSHGNTTGFITMPSFKDESGALQWRAFAPSRTLD